MKKRTVFHICLSVALFATVLSCTVQQGQSLLSSRTGTEDAVAKVLTSTPFAYDLVVDTLSYNSCIGTSLNGNHIPGFKLGANEGFADFNGTGAVKGGLKLRSDFLQYIGKNMPPSFPNTTVTSNQIKYILQNSDVNKLLTAQYAVRTTSDLKVVPDTINPSAEVVLGRDGVLENGILSEDPIAGAITKNIQIRTDGTLLVEGSRIYNVGGPSNPDPFEATFEYSNITDSTFPINPGFDDSMGAGEEYADRIRTKFNSGTYALALTYGGSILSTTDDGASGLNTPMRPTGVSDPRKAYGRSYLLNFSSKNSSLSSQRKNLLTSVAEKNLENNQNDPGASWDCKNIVIMKPNELNNKNATEVSCAELIADDFTVPRVADMVKRIRRHYPEEYWAVGLLYNKNETYVPTARAHIAIAPFTDNGRALCLVNKVTDCYLPTKGIVASDSNLDVGVQYDTTKECYLSRYTQMGVSYQGGLTGDSARQLGRCPQYASICIRSSTSF